MRYQIDTHHTYSFASVTEPTAEVVVAYISVDTHDERTIADQAVSLMYGDALLSGAGSLERNAFLDAVNQLGASISVKVVDGVVNITLRSTVTTFKRLLTLVELMLTEPQFSKRELKRIRQTTINGLHESKENSKAIAQEQLRNAFYGSNDRRYTYDIDETISEVATTDVRHLKAFHQTLDRRIWVCSIAGPQPQQRDFERSLQRLRKGATITDRDTTAHAQQAPKPTVLLTDIPSRSNIDFSIGAPIPFTLHHPQYLPLAFGIAVLAKWGGFAGRLMSTVREKEGLTYGIYGKLEGFTAGEQGYWRIMTFFSPERSVEALTSTFREIRNIHQQGITEEEFLRFQTILETGQTLLNDSMTTLLNDLHGYHCQGFTVEEILKQKARIRALTRTEVNEALRTYLDPRTLTISGAGPIKAVEKELRRFQRTVS